MHQKAALSIKFIFPPLATPTRALLRIPRFYSSALSAVLSLRAASYKTHFSVKPLQCQPGKSTRIEFCRFSSASSRSIIGIIFCGAAAETSAFTLHSRSSMEDSFHDSFAARQRLCPRASRLFACLLPSVRHGDGYRRDILACRFLRHFYTSFAVKVSSRKFSACSPAACFTCDRRCLFSISIVFHAATLGYFDAIFAGHDSHSRRFHSRAMRLPLPRRQYHHREIP